MRSVTYKLKIKKAAKKRLDAAPEFIRKKIEAELKKAQLAPRNQKKMEGFEDRYRIRAGNWRVIYDVEDAELIVTVVKIGSRGDVYKG